MAESSSSSRGAAPRSTRSRSRSPVRRDRSPSPSRHDKRPDWDRRDRERPTYRERGGRGGDSSFGRRSWNDRREDDRDRRSHWKERRYDRAYSPRRSRSPSPRPRRSRSPDDGSLSPRRRGGYRGGSPPSRRGTYYRRDSRPPRSVSPPPPHPPRRRSPSPMLQYSPPPEDPTPLTASSKGKGRDLSPSPPPRKVDPPSKPIPTFPRKSLPTGPRNPDLIVLKPVKPVRAPSPIKRQVSPVRSPVKRSVPIAPAAKVHVPTGPSRVASASMPVAPAKVAPVVPVKAESMLERLKRTAKPEITAPAPTSTPLPVTKEQPAPVVAVPTAPAPSPAPAPHQANQTPVAPISIPLPPTVPSGPKEDPRGSWPHRSRVSWTERSASTNTNATRSPSPPPTHTSSPMVVDTPPSITTPAPPQPPALTPVPPPKDSPPPILRGLEALPSLSVEFEGEWEKAFALQQTNINNLRGPYTFAAAQYRMAGHELANADLEWRAAMERRRIAEAALEAIRLT